MSRITLPQLGHLSIDVVSNFCTPQVKELVEIRQ